MLCLRGIWSVLVTGDRITAKHTWLCHSLFYLFYKSGWTRPFREPGNIYVSVHVYSAADQKTNANISWFCCIASSRQLWSACCGSYLCTSMETGTSAVRILSLNNIQTWPAKSKTRTSHWKNKNSSLDLKVTPRWVFLHTHHDSLCFCCFTAHHISLCIIWTQFCWTEAENSWGWNNHILFIILKT